AVRNLGRDRRLRRNRRIADRRDRRSRTLSGPDRRRPSPRRQSLGHRCGTPAPAIIVSGDTGSSAEREARAAGLMLLPKPVVAATLRATAISLMTQHAVAMAR